MNLIKFNKPVHLYYQPCTAAVHPASSKKVRHIGWG